MTETIATDELSLEEIEAIRIDYSHGREEAEVIAARYGLSVGDIKFLAWQRGWTARRQPSRKPTGHGPLIRRLFRLLDGMTQQMEKNLAQMTDKDVAALGNLVRSMEKLIEIEASQNGRPDAEAETPEDREIRRELEKRINEITKA